MKRNILFVLIMLLALCCFIGCDNSTNSGVNNGNDENVNTGNNENSNNGTTEETTDWWIGTWKSQVYETTLPTSKEINFYYLFEIKYSNSDERRTFICSIIDNDSNVIYNDDATVSTKGYTYEGTWEFHKNNDNIGDSISLRKNDGGRIFEGGLRIDYEKQQLFIYDWETTQHEYCTKIK